MTRTLEYYCKDCQEKFSYLHHPSIKEDPAKCKYCNGARLKKVLTVPRANRRTDSIPPSFKDKKRHFDSPEDMKKHLDYET